MNPAKLYLFLILAPTLTGTASAQTASAPSAVAQSVSAQPAVQSAAAEEAGLQAERARLESQVVASEAQVMAARARLEAARAELERAAQEVAHLSAQRFRPWAEALPVQQGFMPVGRPTLGLNLNSEEEGVRVIGVTPNGPGQAAGVQSGDLIVSINGVEVDGSAGGNATRRFFEVLGDAEPGSAIALRMLRDGEPRTVEVTAREESMPIWFGNYGERFNVAARDAQRTLERRIVRTMERPFPFGAWSDMELVELTPGLGSYFGTETGLLVVRAPAGDEIDLRDGDVILEIGGRTPLSVGHAMRILRSFEPDETLEVRIMREQRERTLAIDVPEAGNDFDIVVEID